MVKSIKNPRGDVFLRSEVIIPPESRKILNLTYHPQKMGVVNESVTIYSNDPRRPNFYVFLSGYVEEGEKIIIFRKNQRSFIVLNNTPEKITVIPWESIEPQQTIDPYKSIKIDLGPKKATQELTISLGFKEEGD